MLEKREDWRLEFSGNSTYENFDFCRGWEKFEKKKQKKIHFFAKIFGSFKNFL